jgi:hypothetical protein
MSRVLYCRGKAEAGSCTAQMLVLYRPDDTPWKYISGEKKRRKKKKEKMSCSIHMCRVARKKNKRVVDGTLALHTQINKKTQC